MGCQVADVQCGSGSDGPGVEPGAQVGGDPDVEPGVVGVAGGLGRRGRSCGGCQEGADDLAALDGVPVPVAEGGDQGQAAPGLGLVVGAVFFGDAGQLVVDGDEQPCPVAEQRQLDDGEACRRCTRDCRWGRGTAGRRW